MKEKVLVGISGGVDSAVSAWLLKEQGYDVVGGFMKNYVSEGPDCTTRKDADEAIKVCKFLGIKLISFDFVKEYDERIIQYIYDGYEKGITPNPDILCNNLIKFDIFLEKALEQGFDKIAMGHYASVKMERLKNGKIEKGNVTPSSFSTGFPSVNASMLQSFNHDIVYKLYRGIDYNKDQSYFLSGLNQFQLSKALFPIGGMTKPEVRELAKEIALPNADRKDSQGLCFIGKVPIKKFLEQKLQAKDGNIVNLAGKIVGKHQGAYFFTIGQKQGLNLNFKAYVISIDIPNNLVIVGDKEDEKLYKSALIAKNRHRIGKQYPLPLEVKTKIRYRQEPQEATLKNGNIEKWKDGKMMVGNIKSDIEEGGDMLITFKEKQWAVAPGQTVVAYVGDECVGNGIIG